MKFLKYVNEYVEIERWVYWLLMANIVLDLAQEISHHFS